MTDRNEEDVQERERTTIDDARKEGIVEPEEGAEPVVPSYADTGDVVDLGVDEPVVPKNRQGRHRERPAPDPRSGS